jgi:hypothetical protein
MHRVRPSAGGRRLRAQTAATATARARRTRGRLGAAMASAIALIACEYSLEQTRERRPIDGIGSRGQRAKTGGGS